MLSNYKVLQTKPGLRLVSWMYRDIVHYGFENDEQEMLETFSPTTQVKGNVLRAYVFNVFKTKLPWQYQGKWPSIAMDVDEIHVGDIFVYEIGKGRVIFAQVTEINQSLIYTMTHEGRITHWLYDKLNAKLQNKDIQIIALESVPEEFRTFSGTD